jgi:hypothetical protein
MVSLLGRQPRGVAEGYLCTVMGFQGIRLCENTLYIKTAVLTVIPSQGMWSALFSLQG